MKICLVNSDYYDVNPRLPQGHCPMGLLMLAAVLEQNNYEVALLDFPWLVNQRDLIIDDEFSSKLARLTIEKTPDIIGFNTLCSSYPLVLRMAQHCKELNPKVKIILGGPQASLVDLETLHNFPCVDIIVRGEGELTMIDLLDALKNGRNLGQVPGITYRNESQVTRTESRALIKDLDSLPLPAYHLIDESIRSQKQSIGAWRISVGRGCPYHCAFCSTSLMWQRHYRLRGPAHIIKEILFLKERYGFINFGFEHDNLAAHPSKFKELCYALIQHNLNINWGCGAKIDTITPDLLDLMVQAGCKGIAFGIESGSARTQHIIQKDTDVSIVPKIINECRKRHLSVDLSFIVGFPEETPEDIDATLRLALRCAGLGNIRNTWIVAFCPLAGTVLFEQYQDKLTWTGLFSDFIDRRLIREKEIMVLIRQYPLIFSAFYSIKPPQLSQELPYELQNIFERMINFYPKFCEMVLKQLRLKPLALWEKFKEWVKEKEPGVSMLDLDFNKISQYFFAFLSRRAPRGLHPERVRRERARIRQEFESARMVNSYAYWSVTGITYHEFMTVHPYLNRGNRLLDINMGTGREGISLIKNGVKVIGLEVSFVMAKKTQELAGWHQVKFPLVVGEPQWLPFKPASFGVVFMPNTLIQHIPGRLNRIGVLRQAYRVLLPHGTVLMHFRTPGFDFRPVAGYVGARWLRLIIIGLSYLYFTIITFATNLQRKLLWSILGRFYRGLEPWDQVHPSGELIFFHWYQERDEAMWDLLHAGFAEIDWVPAASSRGGHWPQPSQDFFGKGVKL